MLYILGLINLSQRAQLWFSSKACFTSFFFFFFFFLGTFFPGSFNGFKVYFGLDHFIPTGPIMVLIRGLFYFFFFFFLREEAYFTWVRRTESYNHWFFSPWVRLDLGLTFIVYNAAHISIGLMVITWNGLGFFSLSYGPILKFMCIW